MSPTSGSRVFPKNAAQTILPALAMMLLFYLAELRVRHRSCVDAQAKDRRILPRKRLCEYGAVREVFVHNLVELAMGDAEPPAPDNHDSSDGGFVEGVAPIMHLYQHPDLRDSLGAAGARDVEQFAMRKVTEQFLTEVSTVAPGVRIQAKELIDEHR